MKITIDATVFGRQKFGGVSEYLNQLLNHVSKKNNFTLVKPLKPMRVMTENHKKFHSITQTVLSHYTRGFTQCRINKSADVFHTPYYSIPNVKVKNYVTTVHDFTYEFYKAGLKSKFHVFQKHRSIREADNIICVSNNTKNDLLNFFPTLDEKVIRVIPLGVDREVFYPELLPENRWMNDQVLFVGRREEYKRFDLAINSVSEVPELRLGIVGPRLNSDEINKLEEKLKGRYNLFESIDEKALRQLYSSSFALIFPSQYEGFGLPLIEAMSCGLPVIAPYAHAFKEVGKNAYIHVEMQTPEAYKLELEKLMISSNRDDIVKKGLVNCEDFSWGQMAEKTFDVYSQ